MKVKQIEIVAICMECGNSEFYSDDNGSYWCVDCGEPHRCDDFDLMTRLIKDDIDIDFGE